MGFKNQSVKNKKKPAVRKFNKKNQRKSKTTKKSDRIPADKKNNGSIGKRKAATIQKLPKLNKEIQNNDGIEQESLMEEIESNFGSSPKEFVSKKSPQKKRVSFAGREDSDDSIPTKKKRKMSNVTPLRPILKSPSTVENEGVSKPKRVRIAKEANLENGENVVEKRNKKKRVNVETEPKKMKPIAEKNIDRSLLLKEKLNNMTTKQRRAVLRELKAKKKPYYELAVKAKELWEKIRNTRMKNMEQRQKFIKELYSLVEGKVHQLIFAHDTVRVIQCLMTLKNQPEIRTKLFQEMKDEILPMTKSKYAKFFVIKMLKYGTPAQREYMMQQFYGKVPQLLKHAVASGVVEFAYNEYANALQRSRFISEFYSPEFALWKVDQALSLEQILQKEPARKPAIVQSMKEHILDISTKPVLTYSLVHRLVREFLENCDEADRKDVIDSLKERVIEMVHTRDGTLCAMKCIWYGSAKDRRTIVRTFKSLVTKTCCEEHGHMVLLAIFDTVDELKLIQKIFMKEIENNLEEIVKNKYGMKVLHYLLKPRCGIQFVKPIIKILQEGDNFRSSEKETNERYNQLLSSISPALLQHCTDHIEELILDPHTSLLVLSILQNAVGDKTEAFRALCSEVLSEEFIPMNLERLHAVELSHTHFILKWLIKNDRVLAEKGESTFSETLISELSDEHLLSWMSCNKGAFILVCLFETGIESVREKVVSVVNSPIGKKKLKQYTFPAAGILAKKCFS